MWYQLLTREPNLWHQLYYLPFSSNFLYRSFYLPHISDLFVPFINNLLFVQNLSIMGMSIINWTFGQRQSLIANMSVLTRVKQEDQILNHIDNPLHVIEHCFFSISKVIIVLFKTLEIVFCDLLKRYLRTGLTSQEGFYFQTDKIYLLLHSYLFLISQQFYKLNSSDGSSCWKFWLSLFS